MGGRSEGCPAVPRSQQGKCPEKGGEKGKEKTASAILPHIGAEEGERRDSYNAVHMVWGGGEEVTRRKEKGGPMMIATFDTLGRKNRCKAVYS